MAEQLPISQVASQAQGLASQAQSLSAPLTAQVKTSTQQLSEVASGTNNLLNNGFGNLNVFANQIDSELSEFSSKLTDTIEGVVSPVQQAILQTTTAIDVGLGGAVVNAQSVAKNISANIGGTINSIVAQVPAIGQIGSFANQLNGSIANVSTAINNIGGTISGISGVISGATSGISSSINNIGGAIGSITGSGVGAAAGLSNAIGGITGKLGNKISGLTAPFDKITETVTDFNSKLTGGLAKINNKIANVTSTLDDINTFLTNPGAIIQGKLDELIDAGIAKIMEPINQLVNFGYNLANQINAATNIVTQELTNLTEYVGGIFTGVSTLLSNAINGSDFYKENNLNYADGEIIQTENGPKLLSPLRRFNHYNYVITLGILEPEEFNIPSSYRGSGFKKVILQSGGGAYDRRIQTFEEGNNHMEYFIEDLEIDAVVAPNSNTGIALGTTISFKVVEPYSMGKFIETIVLGAEETGHKQYMQAPFCLKIDFVGWNETGERPLKIQRPKYVPIMFTKMDFDVSEEGSVYTVDAVAYSETALSDNVNQALTSVEASGRTVAEVLETTKDSVGRNLSSKVARDEKEGKIKGGDRYIICFPKTKTALYEAAQGLGTTPGESTNTAGQEMSENIGSEQESVRPDNPQAAESNVAVEYVAAPQTYQRLKAWATNKSNLNVIGKSPVFDDSRATDRDPHPSAKSAYDSENLLFNRQYKELQSEGRTKPYNWHEGTRITTMIEDVLNTSAYLLDSVSEDRDIPFFKWYRIETMVFIEPNNDAECQIGRPRRTYVYAVHPYFPDEAKIIAPGEAPKGNNDIKRKALKEYNYIYTGKNEDILDFKLNFNQAFYQNVLASYSEGPESLANQKTNRKDSKGSKLSENCESSTSNTEINAEITQQVNIRRSRGGAEYEAGEFGTKRRIAEGVHETIINSPINMVTAEMEIWGDPYFIPTEQGNYSPTDAGPAITQDSTMNYLQNEVFCIVNFRTPLDYKINGFVMNMPELVRPFSGVFQIWAVTNRFSEGQFTQTLKLIRRPNQNAEPTEVKGYNRTGDSEISQQPSGQPGFTSAGQTPLGGTAITGFPPSAPSQVGGNQGATRSGRFGDGLRGPADLGQTLGTPLTIPDTGVGSLLPPRPTDQIINSANAALDRITQTPAGRPPTSNRVNVNSAPNLDITDDARAARSRVTGVLPSGFNPVRIPGL